MNISQAPSSNEGRETLVVRSAYGTFKNGKPQVIPYVVDALLPENAFSILAGKPKHGKSSLARYEAVCVAKGQPLLGRPTQRGEVLLISLEDPAFHVDNCLSALQYDGEKDAAIHIVDRLPANTDDAFYAIEEEIRKRPQIRLVIIDTLAKLIPVKDGNDYSVVLPQIRRVSDLARRMPHVHIQALVHCKKVMTDDPFDSLLGSTAYRGEPDTSIVLYKSGQQHIVASETRIGKAISPTVIEATMVDIAGAEVVSGYVLGSGLAALRSLQAARRESNDPFAIATEIFQFLQDRPDQHATREEIRKTVKGKNEVKIKVLEDLAKHSVLATSGKKQSPIEPLAHSLPEDWAEKYEEYKKAILSSKSTDNPPVSEAHPGQDIFHTNACCESDTGKSGTTSHL